MQEAILGSGDERFDIDQGSNCESAHRQACVTRAVRVKMLHVSATLDRVEPWCRGLTCLPVTQETAGSNPVGSAISLKLSYAERETSSEYACSFLYPNRSVNDR